MARLSDQQVQQFQDDGFLFVRGHFSQEEVGLLLKIGRADRKIAQEAMSRLDAQGGQTKLALSNDLGDDIYSAFVRCPRVVGPMTQLLGGEVYHWHHKMMLKEPRTGGAWEWHQDYGYWYKNNGCLYPDMASCMVAVDRATRENGCLQVVRGSHKCGRVEHGFSGEQVGADMQRVEAMLERLELVYAEMEPGDALFFHGNTMHRSDQNRSEHPRWSLICCYNTKWNDPIIEESVHPHYTPLAPGRDEEILEVGRRQLAGA